MVLLSLLAVGLLSLSSVALRGTTMESARSEARANARLALVVALGELQKEMGPDMRVSAEAALFDQNIETERIDGVAQPHWMASYHSWGGWLNDSYAPRGGRSLTIADTYGPRREPMFRRWLVSLPGDLGNDINAASSGGGLNADNSVVLINGGTIGELAMDRPEKVTRAYLAGIGESGRHAWWIGPENHKAKVDLGGGERALGVDTWATSQGSTAEVGVSALPGFEVLERNPELAAKLATLQTLGPSGVDPLAAKEHFFDLTGMSGGVLASVRTGRLKKDLSLLFEQDAADLPDRYRFDQGDVREPSIRPMSPDLASNSPQTPGRHFASWSGMRHYYRMYRSDSDALSPAWTNGGTSGKPALNWSGAKPYTDVVATSNCFSNSSNDWDGKDSYLRIPVLAKLTFIHSLMTERAGTSNGETTYRLYLVYTPVYTYWNPYNVELRIPNGALAVLSSAYKIFPLRAQLYTNGTPMGGPKEIFVNNTWSQVQSGSGGDVVFQPGEFRLFSHDTITGGIFGTEIEPGFDPMAYGGQKVQLQDGSKRLFTESDRPALELQFSHSVWGGNVNHGNTPGSLDVVQDWAPEGAGSRKRMALNYQIDWFNTAQYYTPITVPGEAPGWIFDNQPLPVAFTQLTMKGLSEYAYESINWAEDWRCRNWLHAPAFNLGSGIYISEDEGIANAQRTNCPYVMNFGPIRGPELPKVVFHIGEKAFLGSGASPFEKINAAPALELPTAPVSSLAGFAGMRIKPGWTEFQTINPAWSEGSQSWHATAGRSLVGAEVKALAYQSGVTGPGIGNSFAHPVIPRTEVYQFFNNSVSMDPVDRRDPGLGHVATDTKAFSDFWDHAFLLNDALWDDYFVSSLADQRRPGASAAVSLDENFDRLVAGEPISNVRYDYHAGGLPRAKVKADLEAEDGYLRAAAHLMVDGMFNVNSTSVDAWHALFAGIRERQVVYRDESGQLRPVEVPSGKRIALSRFEVATSGEEMDGPEYGVDRGDGVRGWSGVRFLEDDQLLKLAGECVKQVKRRGPFLNFAEFINRRLSDDELGLRGALQSAIDYDDGNPESGSINYRFKNGPDFMMDQGHLGTDEYETPEAVEGSRFTGIPGYLIQSDLLRPIANTLSVRDDTFRIRAYGESLDQNGDVVARAWCEAIVQRIPEYYDPRNDADEPAREMDASGRFVENGNLTDTNRRFGRRFQIESFRWLSAGEI
ncbi:hypothetical protein [Haloferula sp. A504]|uniref:hypothetical protein n=1 Tax=Haloferula sp. A504 TaxID=3373601 RepID=UPI0031BCBF4A|nr:hypothetical protein [Verrucomicrobiaceae bacterium E54]